MGETQRGPLSIYISFVIAFTTIQGNTIQPIVDPCTSSETRELPFLRQRVVGYELADGESPICDQYFYKGWYKMYDNVIASTDRKCGTDINWYRKGALPEEIGREDTINYCLNIGNGECGLEETGKVIKCSDEKYVFQLLPLPGCPQAYCIEKLNNTTGTTTDDEAPDISQVSPHIEANVTLLSGSNELQFYCDFEPPENTSYFYTVEWGITSGVSWTDSLFESNAVQFINLTDFRNKTRLTETTLKVKNFGRLGIHIACLVRAMKTVLGLPSKGRPSDSKFCGIEIVNKEPIKLEDTGKGQFDLRLTVPFGCHTWENNTCSLGVTMFVLENQNSNCRPSGLSQASIKDRIDNRCGIKIINNEIGKSKTIQVEADLGQNREKKDWNFRVVLATQKDYKAHPLFQNYVLDMVKVDVLVARTRVKGKCHSNNDPHMVSFDRVGDMGKFENQNNGIFILYRNSNKTVQVQVQTSPCYKHNSKIFCNCGVAVSAGRDVFIMNSCGANSGKWLREFRCKDQVLSNSIKTDRAKQKFVVYLPTGTEVLITLSGHYFQPFLNVQVTPSLADWNQTEGLCGLFNGDAKDDRQLRPGSTKKDINLSWGVLPNESLFDQRNDIYLKEWSSESFLCNCTVEWAPVGGASGPENIVQCSAHKTKARQCKDTIFKDEYKERCSFARKKRNAHGHYVQRDVDKHVTTSTKFVSKLFNTFPLSQRHKRDVTNINYTEASARQACLKTINTTAFQMCSLVPTVDVNKYVEDCTLDALSTNSMEWTASHLDAMKGECVQEVKVNQPLTAEDLKTFQPEPIDSNITTTMPSSTLQTTLSPVFTSDFLSKLEDVACLNDCTQNGICEKGLCVCNDGFSGADCSVDSSKPPIMTGIPDDGECDLQYRKCLTTSVYGINLVQSETLSCHIKPFQINTESVMETENTSYKNKGTLQTFMEVSCPLETTREKRADDTETYDYMAKGYTVSVSNDGKAFSEEDVIIIYDSECVNCTKDNDKIVCIQRPGYCTKHGQCYRFGDKYDCYVCTGGIDGQLSWVPGKECPLAVPPPPQSKKLWVIAAVICPSLVVIVGVILGCIYKSKRTLAKRKTRVMDSLSSSKATINHE